MAEPFGIGVNKSFHGMKAAGGYAYWGMPAEFDLPGSICNDDGGGIQRDLKFSWWRRGQWGRRRDDDGIIQAEAFAIAGGEAVE